MIHNDKTLLTYRQALNSLTKELSEEYSNPYYTGLNLLSNILSVEETHIILNVDKPLSKTELATVVTTLDKLKSKYPVSYIIGNIEFFREKYTINPDVLVPRPESELIVERSLKFLNENTGRKISCIEIGTGSGCLSISILNNTVNTNIKILATDISQKALKLARLNAGNILEKSRLNKISFLKQDFRKKFPEGKYHLIFSNPPYISLKEYQSLINNLKHEPIVALTDHADGLTFYGLLAEFIEKKLASKGKAIIEIHSEKTSEVMDIFREKLDNTYKIIVLKDLYKRDRIIEITGN